MTLSAGRPVRVLSSCCSTDGAIYDSIRYARPFGVASQQPTTTITVIRGQDRRPGARDLHDSIKNKCSSSSSSCSLLLFFSIHFPVCNDDNICTNSIAFFSFSRSIQFPDFVQTTRSYYHACHSHTQLEAKKSRFIHFNSS